MTKKKCPICRRNMTVDYRDLATLTHYLTPWSKIKSSHESGACAKHQRRLGEAVKRARYMALLPYSSR